MADSSVWNIWIDTGGTFTDCLAYDPAGGFHQTKVLSSSTLRGYVEATLDATHVRVRQQWGAPDDFVRGFPFRLLGAADHLPEVKQFSAKDSVLTLEAPLRDPLASGTPFEVCSPEEAPLLAARLVTSTPLDAPLPSIAMRLATTRGTNALLERHGANVALFITEGFGDLLAIGTQQRPELFTLNVQKPAPLYSQVVEVPERLAADGTIVRPLDLAALTPAIKKMRRQGITNAAVALLHSYRNPQHEQALVELLQREGFTHVSSSAELAPFIKILPRGLVYRRSGFQVRVRLVLMPPRPFLVEWECGNGSGRGGPTRG